MSAGTQTHEGEDCCGRERAAAYCRVLRRLSRPNPNPDSPIPIPSPNPNRSGGRTNGLVTCPYKYAPLVVCEQVKLHYSKITVSTHYTYYSGFVAT